MPINKLPKKIHSVDIFLVAIVLISSILALLRVHLLEKDFLEIISAADGLTQGVCYSFIKLTRYLGIEKLTGFTARPPLIPLLLTGAFSLLGHKLHSIYLVYLLPRLLISPFLYLLAKRYVNKPLAFMVTAMSIFFPYYDTYAIATLKADVFVVAWSVIATYWAVRFIKEHHKHQLAWAGTFLALNALSKETALAFSGALLAILTLHGLKFKKPLHAMLYLWIPFILLVGPFMLWSWEKTGRLYPNLYATARDLASFPLNSKTYLLSVPYYAGIAFNVSKSIAFESILRLGLLATGAMVALKRRQLEIILPTVAVLIGISLTHTKVVQGDLVGNREILHRIALVVPFTALLMGIGIEFLGNLGKKIMKVNLPLGFLIGLVMMMGFIFRYFRAPYALDYTENEFYVSAKEVFRHQILIPFTSFTMDGKYCVAVNVPSREALREGYRPYKVTPFPQGLKEISYLLVLLPLIIHIFLSRKQST